MAVSPDARPGDLTSQTQWRQVSIRPAAATDVDRIVEIVNGEPGDDAIALMGSVELAREYRRKMIEAEHIPNPDRVTAVAQAGEEVVGLLQYRVDDRGRHGKLAHLRVLVSLVGPIGVLRRARRLWARTRVGLPVPDGSFYITNLHVETSSQGLGVGAQLMVWAEQEARRLGRDLMTLNTESDNRRAIGLYEHMGFRITRSASHASYTRELDTAGRVLMEKSLTVLNPVQAPAPAADRAAR